MMHKRILKLWALFAAMAMLLGMVSAAIAHPGERPAALQGSLPQIAFLGEGPQTFSLDPPLKFLVKTYQNGEFVFVTVDPPTYEAVEDERVWSVNFLPAESIRLFHQGKSFGQVEAGCVVDFVQIDDNVDNRRNNFFINGQTLHSVEQGMVTYGSFTVPVAGELTFYAEDSIGLIANLCEMAPTETATSQPTATPETPTATPTTTATATSTPENPTATPTVTNTPDVPTSTPTTTTTVVRPTSSPTATATSTRIVTTVTQPAQFFQQTATPTRAPTQTATSFTRTPVPTPPFIPVTGGGPGPDQIAGMGAAILAALGLLTGAWGALLRRIRNGR
jgi:hypothetical protein